MGKSHARSSEVNSKGQSGFERQIRVRFQHCPLVYYKLKESITRSQSELQVTTSPAPEARDNVVDSGISLCGQQNIFRQP